MRQSAPLMNLLPDHTGFRGAPAIGRALRQDGLEEGSLRPRQRRHRRQRRFVPSGTTSGCLTSTKTVDIAWAVLSPRWVGQANVRSGLAPTEKPHVDEKTLRCRGDRARGRWPADRSEGRDGNLAQRVL